MLFGESQICILHHIHLLDGNDRTDHQDLRNGKLHYHQSLSYRYSTHMILLEFTFQSVNRLELRDYQGWIEA